MIWTDYALGAGLTKKKLLGRWRYVERFKTS